MTLKISKDAAVKLFTNKYITPKTLRKALDTAYSGSSWVNFDIGTIRADIQDAFSVVMLEETSDKISAMATLLQNTDAFFTDYVLFEKVIIAFNDNFVDPSVLQGCSVDEIGYGLTVARQILTREQFSDDVAIYVQGCAAQIGLIVYHPTFKFAQPKYENPNPIVKMILEQLNNTTKKPKNEIARHQWSMLQYIQMYIDQRLKQEKEILGS